MAKIFFENKFILTSKLHKQYCKVCFAKMRKSTKILSIVLAIVSFLAAVMFAILKMEKMCFVALILVLYFVLMAFWGYKFSEWINYRGMRRQFGDVILMIVDFFPTYVEVKTGTKDKSSLTFKYTSISKAYETEDLIILIISAKGMIEHGQILFKENFKDDSLDKFRKFINEKTGVELL